MFRANALIYFNPLVPQVPFLYPLKTSENCKVSDVLWDREREHLNKWVNAFQYSAEIYRKIWKILKQMDTGLTNKIRL